MARSEGCERETREIRAERDEGEIREMGKKSESDGNEMRTR